MRTNQGASNIDVKKINKSRIVRLLFENQKLSQQDIASVLNISVPTVLQNVKELLEDHLIEEVGVFQSTGGRKAKAFAPISNAKIAVGLDITKNHVGVVLVDLTGNVVKHMRIHRPFSCTEAYFRDLGEIVEACVADENVLPGKILGVGVSIPGILNRPTEEIAFSHILGLSNLPYAAVCKFIPYPCTFINDANAAGFAEFHKCKPVHNTIYLSLSDTVGGAILLDGRLYEGENQRSGEFGHNTLVPNGKRCYCGKRGCMDAYCAAKTLSQHTQGDLSLFFKQLKAGNSDYEKIWEAYLEDLSFAVNNLRMTFDCDVIVGGYIGKYLDDYAHLLQQKLASLNTFEPDGTYLKICQYKLEASAVGAALHYIEQFFEQV